MPQYKLIRMTNKSSKYAWVLTKAYPGFFNYVYCTQAQVDAAESMEALYHEGLNNG